MCEQFLPKAHSSTPCAHWIAWVSKDHLGIFSTPGFKKQSEFYNSARASILHGLGEEDGHGRKLAPPGLAGATSYFQLSLSVLILACISS